ncbi:hypothetical protein [Mycolicibacterium conceptionense]|uniref:hypothetical protein n=1 Tax=Mycolicibacterium conceptionense TaxID=451644 RepID=UPI000662B180|nr:hypothetical protein [Mycolicibacterium conceptionense]
MTLELIFPLVVMTLGVALAIWGWTRRRKTDPALTRSFMATTAVLTLSGAIALRQVLLPDVTWLHWVLGAAVVPFVVFLFVNVRRIASRTSAEESSVRAFVDEIERWDGAAGGKDSGR